MSGPRVLAVSSGGGHWVELLRLRPALEGCEVSYATVGEGAARDVPGARVHRLRDVTRWEPGSLPGCALDVARALAAERPDVVVTTGALPGLVALALGRATGARTVWLDSLANAEALSASGRAAGWIADLWLTQWPALARPRGPHHAGAVL